MRFTVTAHTTFHWRLILQQSVDVSVWYVWKCKWIVFEDNWINNMVPESWITTCAFILMFWHKQSLAAAHTWINTGIFVPPVGSSKWSLSTRALSHIELLRSESALKFLFSLPCVLRNPSLKSFLIFELAGFPTAILSLEKVVGHRPILIYSHIVDLLLNWKYSLAQ